MASCTSALQYFKCDMCGTYFHMDIFCPHRRQCKGRDSKELKKPEADAIADALDRQSREDRATRVKDGAAASPDAAARPDADKAIVCSGLDKATQRQEVATRTAVAEKWERRQDEALRQQLNDDKMDALLAELDM